MIQVMTTVESAEAARELADLLVKTRLAACVQVIGPIASTYWWEGRIEESQEWMCLAKTRADLFAEIERAIRDSHSYDEPEIIALPVVAVSRSYLQWVRDTVRPTAK